MKEGRPSLTAIYVAFARAVATEDRELSRACQDAAAEALLPRALGKLVARGRRSASGKRLLTALRRSSFGMFEHLALRTRVIDDALSQGIARGCQQVVVLGAGLDSRAHRLRQLAGVTVFEVDHPSTQAMKRRKARALPMMAGALHYVGCDFERVALADALGASCFDPRLRTVWLWEGVTMYLPEPAVADTLDVLSRQSAAGSRLIATYVTPGHVARGGLLSLAGLFLLGAIAEPIRSYFTVGRMAQLLDSRGFAPCLDVYPVALAARHGITLPWPQLATPNEHVVVADKRPHAERNAT